MNELESTLKTGGRNMTILGSIAIILGILAMLAPVMAGLSVAMAVGVLVVLGGILRMIWAVQTGSLDRGLLMFVIGALTLLCGIALLARPLFAAGFLTILLTIYLMVDGIFELVAGIRSRPLPGSVWMILGGVVSILLGIMIWRQYPLSGPWAVGILLGIKLFFIGLIMVTGGSVVRSAVKSSSEAG